MTRSKVSGGGGTGLFEIFHSDLLAHDMVISARMRAVWKWMPRTVRELSCHDPLTNL
jgi:hypothetical protein